MLLSPLQQQREDAGTRLPGMPVSGQQQGGPPRHPPAAAPPTLDARCLAHGHLHARQGPGQACRCPLLGGLGPHTQVLQAPAAGQRRQAG